ncbi:MAG: glutamine synthetase beta-grasp domain-containing protein, partial [Thermomicrobiales bacterium]|nr:glutamine synthetase beta-grasp domain-containing protein [Thermomicrobiales bacterium]
MADDTAPPIDDAAARVLDAMRAAGAKVIDLQFSDITGGAKALTIPVELLETTLQRGYRFDGSALTGQRQVELTLAIVPDPATLLIFPEEAGVPRRARICGMVRRLDGTAFPGDPRSVLADTLAQAQSLGYDYRVSLEIEYYLLSEEAAGPGQPLQNPLSASAAGRYFDAADDRPAQVRDEILTTLAQIGIKVGGAHHETGPGQEELDFLEMGALEMADQLITAREV